MTTEKPRHDGEPPLYGSGYDLHIHPESQPCSIECTQSLIARGYELSKRRQREAIAVAPALPPTAALGTPEGGKLAEIRKRHCADLEAHFDFDGPVPARVIQCSHDRADLLQRAASHARTIEALRAAAEPFAKAWVLIASQQQLAERLSLAQIAELACHELSGADFQRVARALKEHPNG